uniref:Coronin n=1 Tax=Arcella intermedia TaxID=1963864 RepID=A0A6B2L3J3_9EUKA
MVRTTQYRHIFGEVVGQSQFYTDLKPANNAVMSHTIRANKTYFSIGLEGTGGRLGVFPLSNTGRLNKPIPCIETGFDVHDFDFHSFQDNVMATGGDSGAVQVWTIPEGGLASLKSNLTTPTIQLLAHGGKINTIDFHPSANNVLASTATDNKIILWDIQSEQPQVTIPNTDATINITWNATGTVLAASNKDNKILIYDVRTRTPSSEGEGLGGTKGTRIEWIGGKNQIFAIGFTKESNERRYKLMDTRMMNEALYSERIDYGSGVFYTHYQEGMDVIAIWGKGDSSLKFIEMSDEQPYCRYLTDYTSLTMQIGIAFLPLSVCDVKEVEFARILKLTNENTVQPHRLFVPRTRKEYFQDDIFPPSQIRAEVPSQTAQQYFAGEEAEPLRVNLNPGLPLYSEAPKIVRKMKKYKEVVEEDPTKVEEKTLDSIYNKMIEKRDADLPLAHELNEGVDSDEWSE